MSIFFLALLLTTAAPAPAGQVPFVGCATDGQMGLIDPPRREEIDSIPATAAPGLAYYATRSTGTLAPAGWHCYAAHGSNGERLVVAPGPLDFDLVRGLEVGLTGPVVEMDQEYGFTSGRYAIAAMVERHFPAHRDYVDDVKSMEVPLDTLEDSDDLVRPIGPDALAFRTHAGKEGLGTLNALAPDEAPIEGLVLLNPEEDLTMRTLSVRLPDDPALARAILAGAAATRMIELPEGFPPAGPR